MRSKISKRLFILFSNRTHVACLPAHLFQSLCVTFRFLPLTHLIFHYIATADVAGKITIVPNFFIFLASFSHSVASGIW